MVRRIYGRPVVMRAIARWGNKIVRQTPWSRAVRRTAATVQLWKMVRSSYGLGRHVLFPLEPQ